MVRKALLILVILFLVGVPVFSIGIGGAFNLGIGGGTVGPGAMLSLKLDEFPAVFGLGVSIGSSIRIGATADWWLWGMDLGDILYLYVGPGLYARIGGGFDVGARVPVGLQFWVIDPLELFLEVAPAIGISLIGGALDFPDFKLQSSLGFRFWF